MPDCEHPKCHEHVTTELKDKVSWEKFNALRDCVSKKTPKSWLWIGFVVIGLPLLITGAKVWSETERSADKYMPRDEMQKHITDHITDIVTCKEAAKHMGRIVDEIKSGQREMRDEIKAGQIETRREIKEILKLLAK